MKTIVFSGKELYRVIGKGRKNIERLEKELNVKIEINDFGEIKIEGKDPLKEYLCAEMMDALSIGFEIESVIVLKDEENIYRKILLKNLVKPSRIRAIRGRIIGTGGKAKRITEELSETSITVSENVVGIIGLAENVQIANTAISMIISGNPHSSVYKYLEKTRSMERDSELPLSEIIREDVLNPKKTKTEKPKSKISKNKKTKTVKKIKKH